MTPKIAKDPYWEGAAHHRQTFSSAFPVQVHLLLFQRVAFRNWRIVLFGHFNATFPERILG
jgi:hypothetical protein